MSDLSDALILTEQNTDHHVRKLRVAARRWEAFPTDEDIATVAAVFRGADHPEPFASQYARLALEEVKARDDE